MMWKDAYDFGVYHIQDQYEKREAGQIMKILLEDCFTVTNLLRKEELNQSQIDSLKIFVERLKLGEPIQYVTGKTNFMGYDLMVNQNVLIPRPETEELVDWIVQDHIQTNRQLDVLDIGTGSGCIAIATKKLKPSFRVFAIEESIEALNVGRINAKRLRAKVEFLRVDMLERDAWKYLGAFDIIVSNPPYIPEKEKSLLEKRVLDFEPYEALFVNDDDPLMFYRSIADFAQDHLNPSGTLYFEINEFNYDDLIKMFHTQSWSAMELRKDMQGKKRMIKLTK